MHEQDMFSGQSIRLAVKCQSWKPLQKEWTLAAQCIQTEEKLRIGKFVFKKDAKSAMVGRLLMRYAISKMLQVPSSVLLFSRTEKGKPFLLSPVDKTSACCDVSFNISHHGDYVVLAADRRRQVGVDIMKVDWQRNKSVDDFFKTMVDQLTSEEWKQVKIFNSGMEQLKIFLRFWCLKESVVKCLGTGIGFEVSRLNFTLNTPNIGSNQTVRTTKVEIDGDPAPEWSFEETLLENHCVAVAVQDAVHNQTMPPPAFRVLDIQDILLGCDPLPGTSPDLEYWQLFSSREEEPQVR